MELEGKVALVTGGGCGIGSAVALRLSENGAKVVVNDVVSDHAEKIVNQIRSSGGEAAYIQADISRYEEAEKLMEKTVEVFGTLDILINNAGITRDKLMRDMEEKDWDDVLNINLKGAFNCSKFATPIMVEKKFGKIVSLSSRAHLGNPGQANYSSSKAGIIGLTRSMALEFGRYNINVNAIAPGMIETEGLKSHPKYDAVLERALKITPLKRVGKPEDVANLVLFLVSEKSSYITGEVIHITGGRY
ncbi:MAG: SDR family NAD(P)-dependent oxidoreductase [Desulfatiglans sp.]|nr:SDR family NAD(P)-dependent oxidoreductase [Thermodesulfobacteriota bacterium]MEE4352916.1 SDR family NAD(P)-dependent oxidoreductase [Desulfatiglans sp.]